VAPPQSREGFPSGNGRFRSHMRSLAAIAVGLSAALVLVAPAAPSQSVGLQRRVVLEAAVVRQVNHVRLAHRLAALRVSPNLRAAARSHSRSMLELGYFGHDSADGTAFSDRIRRHYTSRGWRMWSVGEALIASEGREVNAHAIVAAWLESPPHREIVLSPTWRETGIGALYAPSAPNEYAGAATIVVTADFGLRTGKIALS
jgi:uncharacterized protein YkwD